MVRSLNDMLTYLPPDRQAGVEAHYQELKQEVEGLSAIVRPFYRFRSIDALLGKRAELDSQELYFASPADLNDPM